MDLRWVLTLGVLVATAFAGCGGKEAPPGPVEDLSGTHGAVVGLITDDEARPVDGAEIALKTLKVSPIALKILTNSEGRFRLENVPAGRQTVLANKDGYLEASTAITVVPGAETTVRLVMRPVPTNTVGIVPLAEIQGLYTCALEAIQVNGECEYEVENQTKQEIGADITRNNHTWNIPPGWSGLAIEIVWQEGAPMHTVSYEGLRLNIESQEDLGGKFISSEVREKYGRILINQGQVSPDATLGYPIPQRGVATWIHVLPLGTGQGATCQVQCAHGVGAAVQINYKIYIAIFYGQKVPEDYTQLG
jgi:hypothetical protein